MGEEFGTSNQGEQDHPEPVSLEDRAERSEQGIASCGDTGDIEDALAATTGQEMPHSSSESSGAQSIAESEESAEEIVMPDPVLEKLDELGASMRAFRELLERHLIETEGCSRSAFDRLYEEMRQYKDNFVFEVQRGLLLDVLLLYDGIEQLKRHYATAQNIDGQALMANLDGLAIETEEILLRRGLERLTESPDKLDPYLQKTVRVLQSNDPDEDMAIVERLKVGFRLGDRMFRKEEVVIKKYAQSPPQPEESGHNDPVSRPEGEAHNE